MEDRKTQVLNSFRLTPNTTGGGDQYAELNDLGAQVAGRILELVPEGREQALALTELENAINWAIIGISKKAV